jgi:hypothetical protein
MTPSSPRIRSVTFRGISENALVAIRTPIKISLLRMLDNMVPSMLAKI